MQLLVSVRDACEARAALAGGADVIDAKDPGRGALGPVTRRALEEIERALEQRRPLSAALGDAVSARKLRVSIPAARRLAFLKLGFAGKAAASRRTLERLARTVQAASPVPLILVAYGDWAQAASPRPAAILEVARAIRAAGVLLDTALKQRRLLELMTEQELVRWIATVQEAGLAAAIAGGLIEADISTVRRAGAVIAGVRGAACVPGAGRLGPIAAERVARLSALAHQAPLSRRPALVERHPEAVELVGREHDRLDSLRMRPSEVVIDQ